jgi:hypothetical protein
MMRCTATDEKTNALYRDQMTVLHMFFNKHAVAPAIRKNILTYTDAYAHASPPLEPASS